MAPVLRADVRGELNNLGTHYMVRAPVEVDQDHIPLGVVDSHNLLEDKVDKGVVVTWDVGAIHGNERVLVASRVRLVTYLGRNGQVVVVVKGIHCSYFAVREGLLEADFACLVYQIRVTLHTWASFSGQPAEDLSRSSRDPELPRQLSFLLDYTSKACPKGRKSPFLIHHIHVLPFVGVNQKTS